jgi:hypothetical protein
MTSSRTSRETRRAGNDGSAATRERARASASERERARVHFVFFCEPREESAREGEKNEGET